MTYLKQIVAAAIVTLMTFTAGSRAVADEVILDDRSESILIGDFDCASYHDSIGKSFPIDPSAHSVTTGELWSFFKSQGIDSLDRIVLCLDVNPDAGNSDLDLETIELYIKDSVTKKHTKFSLDRGGDNSLVLPCYGASSFEPEAQLEVELGYDFMTRYSESSTDIITLNYSTSEGSSVAAPKFAIAGRSSLLSGSNMLWLVLFALFWIVVFSALFKLTKPSPDVPQVTTKKVVSA